jgi:hypothetical protein
MKSVFVRVKQLMIVAVLLLACIDMTGCFNLAPVVIHNSDVKKFPSYADTEKEWGVVPEGMGRVVIFRPHESNVLSFLTYGSGNVIFKIDDKKNKAYLQDQNFAFIDLPEGRHLFHLRYHVDGKREFDIKSGEIIYINVGKFKIMNRQEAEPLLAEVHHLFMLPLPFDKQDKHAKKQKW